MITQKKMGTKEKVSAFEITIQQRNIIGCRALSGESVLEMSEEFKINREFIYSQKARIKELIESDENLLKSPVAILDKQMVETNKTIAEFCKQLNISTPF